MHHETDRGESDHGFEPEIVAFSCHYCAYAAADLAGVMRLSYPPNVKIVKLPCTGRLDPIYVLQAFEKGADGVFVAGCLQGNCHYLNGNTQASRRVKYLKGVLDQVGLGGERLEMFHMSSAEGTRFAAVATEFTERIRGLGPSPVRAGLATVELAEDAASAATAKASLRELIRANGDAEGAVEKSNETKSGDSAHDLAATRGGGDR